MPRTSLGVRTLRVRPKNKKLFAGGIDDVDGVHVMARLAAYLHDRIADPIKDDSKNRYLRVKEIIPRGRSLTVITESGYFGEAGVTYDVVTHAETHVKGESEAATTETRTTFWCPPGTAYVVVALELRPGTLHGGILLDGFRRKMIDEHENLFFPSTTVMEKNAWAESGNLTEVSVVMQARPIDLSVGIDGEREAPDTVLGRRVYTALPPKGSSTWPNRVWEGLREGKIKAASFVGVRTTDEESAENPDESVYVTVSRDGRTKKFELGSDGIPSVRLALTDDSQPALGIDAFHAVVDSNVRDFYKDVDLAWNPKWIEDDAADEWVAYRE